MKKVLFIAAALFTVFVYCSSAMAEEYKLGYVDIQKAVMESIAGKEAMVSFEDEVKKMEEAIKKIKVVINSERFKEMVLSHKFDGELAFNDNQNLSNEEIYATIMNGKELLNGELDHEMDLNITMYYSWKNTVGYTYPDTERTWVNSKFFNSYTHAEVANNVVHEWTHKLGFDHDDYYNDDRPFSVPYAVGDIIEELIEAME